jgi:hypothetical protein
MMTRFNVDISKPLPRKPLWPDLLLVAVPAAIVLFMLILWLASEAHAESQQSLAQECADSLARRDHLDHEGFGVKGHIGYCDGHGRCARGSRAENVGYGYKTKAAMIAAWWKSPGHAANMRLGPITVADAVSKSGRHYWCGVVGE